MEVVSTSNEEYGGSTAFGLEGVADQVSRHRVSQYLQHPEKTALLCYEYLHLIIKLTSPSI